MITTAVEGVECVVICAIVDDFILAEGAMRSAIALMRDISCVNDRNISRRRHIIHSMYDLAIDTGRWAQCYPKNCFIEWNKVVDTPRSD